MAATCCDLLSPLICHVLLPFHTRLPSLPSLSIRAFRSAATRNNMFGKYAPVKLHKTLPSLQWCALQKKAMLLLLCYFLPLFYFSFLYLDKALKLICSIFSFFFTSTDSIVYAFLALRCAIIKVLSAKFIS